MKENNKFNKSLDLFVIDDNQKVGLHNTFINGRFLFSSIENKIFLQMLARIKKDTTHFEPIDIKLADLYPNAGGRLYKDIKQIAETFALRGIKVEILKNGKPSGDFDTYALFSYIKYRQNDGKGIITAKFNNDIAPYILQLKEIGNFTLVEYNPIYDFKSQYSIRLYWLLKQCRYQGYRSFLVSDLKYMFKLEGKYERFTDFKKHVIEVAQEEINNTDMAFDYSLIKKGREINAILFTLLKQTEDRNNSSSSSTERASLSKNHDSSSSELTSPKAELEQVLDNGALNCLNRMKKLKLSERQANMILLKVDAKSIHSTCYELEVWYLDNKEKNLGAYAFKTFKEKFNL